VAQPPRRTSPWRVVTRIVGMAITLAILAVVAAVVVVPPVAKGASLTVLSGSMQPTLAPGDIAVVRGIAPADVCAQVSVDQIITYLPTPDDPTLVTHRVIAKTIGTFDDGTACRLITQGDANPTPDDPVSPVQVRGVFWYGVPKLGWARQWASEHMLTVWVIVGVLVIGYSVWDFVQPRLRRSAPEPEPAESSAPPKRALPADRAGDEPATTGVVM